MLQDKSVLLEQIQTAIKNKSCEKRNAYISTSSSQEYYKITAELDDERNLSFTRNLEFIKNLEQRIKLLEDQNDHLLYFVHFLFENFPDLVRNVFPPRIVTLMGRNESPEAISGQTDAPHLTRREEEILHLLEKGLCAKEIASFLFICETTVITHKKNLKKKFNARNTVELISKASTIL